MSEHVTAWIAAYHDGELRGAQLHQVESHLHDCAACRAELEALEGLSALLQENPAMPARTVPERFVAQVRLRLRPHSSLPAPMRAVRTGWLLLPLSMLGIWAFLQAVLVMSGLAFMALPLFGDQSGYAGEAVELVLNAILTAVLAALVWGWLAGWWAAHRTKVRSSGEVSR